MSLHKHHLLQVQEQIDFFQEGSEAAALPRLDAERGAGGRAGHKELASPSARRLLAAPAGAGSPLPAIPCGWKLLTALQSQEAPRAFDYAGAPAQADRRTHPVRRPRTLEARLVGLLSHA